MLKIDASSSYGMIKRVLGSRVLLPITLAPNPLLPTQLLPTQLPPTRSHLLDVRPLLHRHTRSKQTQPHQVASDHDPSMAISMTNTVLDKLTTMI
jgi:hypothetical protein